MILADKEILNHIEKGLIKLEPFRLSCLGTNSQLVKATSDFAIIGRLKCQLNSPTLPVESMMYKNKF